MTGTTGLTGISRRRRVKNRAMAVVVGAAFAIAVVPLVCVLYQVVAKGVGRLDAVFLTHSMNNVGPLDAGGGAYHAIVGTVEQVLITSVISLPVAILTAIYLVEYRGRGRLARLVSFFVDVMTGLPSIVAGLFILACWVLGLGIGFSGLAASLALAILMVPMVVRSAEEMLRLVPDELREAGLALGVPKWRTIISVVLPVALPGIVTGVLLAIARVIGETAPLLLVTQFTAAINDDPFSGPQVALPQFIWDQAGKPQELAIDRAWAGALLLIVIVMGLNLLGRLFAWWRGPARLSR